MERIHYTPDDGEGWQLDLVRWIDDAHFDPGRPPVVLVPGYGMNTHVLGFHPEGLSMIEYLARRGFEVWAANLRGQGGSRRVSGRRRIGFRELALVDVPTVLDTVGRETLSTRPDVHAVGASLGATYLYAHLAHHPSDHGLASLVSIGGPLRWDRIHPLLKAAFASPGLVGAIPFFGTRRLARAVLPLVRRHPWLLAIYMNADLIDLSFAEELVQTVEDPHPWLNRQLALWIRTRDLQVGGVNVTEALREIALPVMCILANADGIVPPEAVLAVREVMPESPVDVLEVGDQDLWFAHADLFVSRHAQAEVFAPLAEWLEAHSG